MKLIFFLLIITYSSITLALEIASYHILKGSLHKGGIAKIEITDKTKKKFIAKMNYEIYKRMLVPVPSKFLKGETIIELPPEFKDKRGYLLLEKKGTMDIEKAKIKFIRRTTWQGKNDAMEILILPTNGKSRVQVTYHPTIPAAGWGRVIITFISPYPILDGYHADFELN
ncbi:MAG: hypothetical protein H7281_15530 [Bacteriovorax sp.]|nr:hypothetical protein [Bacteriovorax sp.]